MVAIMIALLVNSASASADCGYFNLYEAKQDPLNQIPVSEQGPSSTCYAHTAAQMVNYYRLSQGLSTSVDVAPLWVALNHKLSNELPRHWWHWDPNSLGNSYLLWALQDLRTKGNCSIENLQSGLRYLQDEWGLALSLTPDELLFLLEQVWPKIGVLLPNDETAISGWIQKSEDLRNFDRELKANNGIDLRGMVQKILSAPRMSHHHSRYRRVLDFLGDQVFKGCKEQEPVSLSVPEINNFGSGLIGNQALLDRLNDWLDPDHRQPVGVGYCDQIYTGKKVTSLSTYLVPRALMIPSTHCGAHYSLIVGRRPDAVGKCEYLIRNSQGSGFWAKKWECFCSNSKTGQKEPCRYSEFATKPAPGVKVLGCWAPQDELAPYVFDLEQLSSSGD